MYVLGLYYNFVLLFQYWSNEIIIFLSFSFTKFRLERSHFEGSEEKCPYDGVYIYENSDIINNTQEQNVFCGNLDNELPEIKSETNTMYVQFYSDSSRNDEGFVGEISFVYGKYSYRNVCAYFFNFPCFFNTLKKNYIELFF